mmetsp:Transcript_26346/g.91634  ORF Transcript_26346/g.91634 Transcript_26346/m.91634 type:complete len:203 (-) Transcript_26346:563-1171(-)
MSRGHGVACTQIMSDRLASRRVKRLRSMAALSPPRSVNSRTISASQAWKAARLSAAVTVSSSDVACLSCGSNASSFCNMSGTALPSSTSCRMDSIRPLSALSAALHASRSSSAVSVCVPLCAARLRTKVTRSFRWVSAQPICWRPLLKATALTIALTSPAPGDDRSFGMPRAPRLITAVRHASAIVSPSQCAGLDTPALLLT